MVNIHRVLQLALLPAVMCMLASCAFLKPATPEVNSPEYRSDVSVHVGHRKNIDELSTEELAAYEHAVDVLKIKSQDNVFDRTGFIWQSWVHNCTAVAVSNTRQAPLSKANMKNYLLDQKAPDSCNIHTFLITKGMKTHVELPGECEHQKNTFLQWHRAQLYFYEKALQAADPEGKSGPSTKNVTLPFWNFTQKPSGVRYPKVFENPNSSLFDSTRIEASLDSSLGTSSPYLLAYILYYDDWEHFGGDEYGKRGGGDLETKIHNRMHADYICGHMYDNQTAALDPIFYVFHNFLDYSFEKWIELNNADQITGSDLYMRGEQDISLPKPQGYDPGSDTKKRSDFGDYLPNMGRASIYYDTKKQGYAFAPSKNDDFIPKSKIQELINQHQQAGFVFGDNPISLFSALLSFGSSQATANPQAIHHGSYKIPESIDQSNKVLLGFDFDRHDAKPDYSFQADVYLYPETVQENIASEDFRNKYLVTNTAHWGLSGEHAVHPLKIQLDVKAVINSLIKDKAGKTWNIALAISGPDLEKISANDFSVPTIMVAPPLPPKTYSGSLQ